ncbi:MAG TPA: hypothetical protein VHH57_13355 [Gaiella sp.]|nr:hypothetical protein [Gaiella sp.]
MAVRGGRRRRSSKGEPFTVRFDRETQRAIEDEARRTRRSRTALVEELADEALRTRRFPGIGFRDSFPNRRAWLTGAGLDVWELCELVDRYPDVEMLLADFAHVRRPHVDLALAYREAYRDEIDGLIAENNRPPEEWRRLYPFVRAAL